MTVLIKLFYAGAVAALLVLLVAFGIRTFYAAPESPQAPQFFGTADPQQMQMTFERYNERQSDYHRYVFLAASIIGVAAVAGGVALSARLDAIRLGLVVGGLGTLLYGVIQAEGDLDDAGTTVIFLVAALGLLLVLAAGHRWLSRLET